MKKPIVIKDLAQLDAALQLRKQVGTLERIEAFHTGEFIPPSNGRVFSDAWINEVSNIDPEAWKELRSRIGPADRTHIVYGTWIDPVPCACPEGQPCTCHIPRIDGELVAPRQSDFSFLDWLKEDEENDDD